MQYKILNKQAFSNGRHSIVPIRREDRFNIMKWRNEQIYHLRQKEILTEKDQDLYFNTTVRNLFKQEQPDQILFSYLENEKNIGYGGLVHINWQDRNAEISFIIGTELEKEEFSTHWQTFLALIEAVADNELQLHKIYTYAFDLRPQLFKVLEKEGYNREATLKEHIFFYDKYIDVIIHSKIF